MSQNTSFTESARARLELFLQKAEGGNAAVTPLTPDASTREYFRVSWKKRPAIACVYPEPFTAAENSYVDVTGLFSAADLPVAEIYETAGAAGVIILEDFGDKILRDVLTRADEETSERLLNEAIGLIARIQAATAKASEMNSIASRLAFDEEKLLWELDFFKTHYFESLRHAPLSVFDEKALRAEFVELSKDLASRIRVLCHRDFHAANLMVDDAGELRVIDHQDARMGTASYDLASLLLDRVVEPPSNVWVREKRFFFLEARERLGLETLDPDEFAYEFRLQAIQRCLKAIGTFSNQTAVRGKSGYVQYIKPMFQIVLQAAERVERFPNLRRIISEEIKE
jgi:N-acetylmuramate 1-kinase